MQQVQGGDSVSIENCIPYSTVQINAPIWSTVFEGDSGK